MFVKYYKHHITANLLELNLKLTILQSVISLYCSLEQYKIGDGSQLYLFGK